MDRNQIAEIIVAEIRETVPELAEQSITSADSMADIGVDSIERSEIILSTLEKLDLKVPMVELHGPRNIGELANLIFEKNAG